MITIFAITGTLSACGRYGSPVRVAPSRVEAEPEISVEDPKAKAVADDESSDRKAKNDQTE